ncbi:MAG: prephenate dehydratase [Dehalococcoidia bacterium]
MATKIGYLGPPGTFTEEAALLYDSKAQLVPFPTISGVGAAVVTGMVEEGLVAIENSIEGSVTDTLDLLIQESSLAIKQEIVLPIRHCLLVTPGGAANAIKVIYSHPQALAQCRRFLERCFPKAQLEAALSTAAAVEEIKNSDGSAAAVATRRAAQLYGVEILAHDIQETSSNVTRFVVLSSTDHPPTGSDRTSLWFSFADDRPGLLVAVLGQFAQRNINLAKVESRPSKESLGQYIFLLDLDGHREESPVREALQEVEKTCSRLKILGSYPKYRPPEEGSPS